MPRTRLTYPWDVDLAPEEYQCGYCGRFMDDVRAIRRLKEDGFTLHACYSCYSLLRHARISTLNGRRGRVRKILKIDHGPGGDYRVYVGREGVPDIKKKVSLREAS